MFKLCRENPTRNVVDWYEMGVMVYFEFWVELVLVWEEIPVKMAQNWPFLLQPDTPMPKHTSACLGVELRLGGGPYA